MNFKYWLFNLALQCHPEKLTLDLKQQWKGTVQGNIEVWLWEKIVILAATSETLILVSLIEQPFHFNAL